MNGFPVSVPPKLREDLLRSGARAGWLHDEAPLVVALSGGGDSVALLMLLLAVVPAKRLVVAHFEHGIRGGVSLADADFVRSLAARYGVSCEVAHANVPACRRRGEGVEEAGRRLRYEFLLHVALSRNARWLCTGHTADDAAETLLFHVARGTGLHGLSAIPEGRSLHAEVQLVRPLLRLGLRREEYRVFLSENGIEWREDSTNQDRCYARNRMRLDILPALEASVNERTREHLANLAEEASSLRDEEVAKARCLLPWCRSVFPGMQRVWRQPLVRTLGSRTLRNALREEGAELGLPYLSRQRLEHLENLIRASSFWRFQWHDDFEIFAGGGFLGWGRRSILDTLPEISLFEDENLCWGIWRVSLSSKGGEREENAIASGRFAFAASEGERLSLRPLAGFKKNVLSLSVPWWARGFWPVFCRENQPLWTLLPGNGVRVLTGHSERICDRMLELSLVSGGEGSVSGCSTNSGEF